MEYRRDKNDQIHAEYCYRLGKVFEQYESLNLKNEEDYKWTLLIALLQSISTNCTQYLEKILKHSGFSDFSKSLFDCGWGLENTVIEPRDRNYVLKLSEYLRHIRNALSHPTRINLDSPSPTTGFCSLKESDEITAFMFIDHPKNHDDFTKIELKVSQLRVLFFQLVNILSQAKEAKWDGHSITRHFKPAA